MPASAQAATSGPPYCEVGADRRDHHPGPARRRRASAAASEASTTSRSSSASAGSMPAGRATCSSFSWLRPASAHRRPVRARCAARYSAVSAAGEAGGAEEDEVVRRAELVTAAMPACRTRRDRRWNLPGTWIRRTVSSPRREAGIGESWIDETESRSTPPTWSNWGTLVRAAVFLGCPLARGGGPRADHAGPVLHRLGQGDATPTTGTPTSTGCSSTACATASARRWWGPSAPTEHGARTRDLAATAPTHVDTADAVHRALDGPDQDQPRRRGAALLRPAHRAADRRRARGARRAPSRAGCPGRWPSWPRRPHPRTSPKGRTMTDLEDLWDDLPVGQAPIDDILRAGRKKQRRTPRRAAAPRPLLTAGVLDRHRRRVPRRHRRRRQPPSDGPAAAGPATPASDASPAAFHGELQPAASCDELLEHYVDRGARDRRAVRLGVRLRLRPARRPAVDGFDRRAPPMPDQRERGSRSRPTESRQGAAADLDLGEQRHRHQRPGGRRRRARRGQDRRRPAGPDPGRRR